MRLTKMKSMIQGAAFALETIAHLQGKEQMLLPFAEHLREADKLLEQLLDELPSGRPKLHEALVKIRGVWQS